MRSGSVLSCRPTLQRRSARTSSESFINRSPTRKTTSIECFEALLRWDHPRLGPIDPSVFIPIAEEHALIHDLGLLVLCQSCRQAVGWKRQISLCVNVSPLQFLEEDLARCVAMVLDETGLDPRRLGIEVTESALLNKPRTALKILDELKALGVRISLDDFGTGFSSLSYFRMFPFDKVKIDQSLIADFDGHASREIVRSIVEQSRSLGMIWLPKESSNTLSSPCCAPWAARRFGGSSSAVPNRSNISNGREWRGTA